MKSQELQSVEAFIAMMRDVLADAMSRFDRVAAERAVDGSVDFADLDITSFKQTWPDASCGFGGMAAQALTDAQTVVANWTGGNVVAVYIRGEFAYLVPSPSEAFWTGVMQQQLPGVGDPHENLSR